MIDIGVVQLGNVVLKIDNAQKDVQKRINKMNLYLVIYIIIFKTDKTQNDVLKRPNKINYHFQTNTSAFKLDYKSFLKLIKRRKMYKKELIK